MVSGKFITGADVMAVGRTRGSDRDVNDRRPGSPEGPTARCLGPPCCGRPGAALEAMAAVWDELEERAEATAALDPEVLASVATLGC